MKTLILLRHAKAEDKSESKNDFERKLTLKGIEDSKLLGDYLKCMKVRPDEIISSPAKRAIQTAEIIKEKINFSKELNTVKEIYSANSTMLLEVIKKFNDNINTIIVVGHNPALEEIVNHLCESHFALPKTGAIGISLETAKWKELNNNLCDMQFFVSPKQINKTLS